MTASPISPSPPDAPTTRLPVVPPQPVLPRVAWTGGPVAPPPLPRRRRGLLVFLAVVGGILAGAGLLAGILFASGVLAAAPSDPTAPTSSRPTPAAPTTFTVVGSLTLTDTSGYGPSISTTGSSCSGTRGFADIRAGAAVTVSDASGTIVGTGNLSAGTTLGRTSCLFSFSVTDVPTSAYYRIQVSHRGEVTMSREDVRAYGASLTLGN